MIRLLGFQQTAVDDLTEKFVDLWAKDQRGIPIILRSPTGSGKTVIATSFINGLNQLANWDQDKAYIWITFSDDLAMQSRDKFIAYFNTSLENRLLTFNDIDDVKKLYKNDVLFLNWQKVVSKSAENRLLRRPEDETERKEKGIYFEDLIENTHSDGREIVLVIDESHKHVDTALARQIIELIDPRITLHISATPDNAILIEAFENNGVVTVNRQDVIDQGLIKEKIVTQTNEDFEDLEQKDLDEVLLELGMQKRKQLKEEFRKMGKNVNPLMLVQLPNDDSARIEAGELTKEQLATNFLVEHGVDPKKIARWFDKHKRPVGLERNDDEHEYLLFKVAAGTGWDCPRAHVLVMFRDIHVDKTYIQTIGRIMRMPEPQLKEDYNNSPNLRIGYLYTNYSRREINENWPSDSSNNKPAVNFAYKKRGTSNIELESAYKSRLDYGDLSNSASFQLSFRKSLNKWFDIKDGSILGGVSKTLQKKGLDLTPELTNKIIVDAEYDDFDQLLMEFRERGEDISHEMSKNDVEKTFNYLCYQFLKEQTEDSSKISNISRSWPPFKRAARMWLTSVLGKDTDYCYRVFILDLTKGPSSTLRPAMTQAIKEYKPLLKDLLDKKAAQEKEKDAPIFTILDEYSFTEDYEEHPQKICVLDKYFVNKSDDLGKKNELSFVEYLEMQSEYIEWWFKNGDHGENYFALTYFNTTKQNEALFYPDWIIKFKNGKVGIFDTKSGATAQTEGRAEALSSKLKQLGDQYLGGIVVLSNSIWHYNDSDRYEYNPSDLGKEWKPLQDVFK